MPYNILLILSFMVLLNDQKASVKMTIPMYRILYLDQMHTCCMADLPAEVKRSLAQEFFDFLKVFGIIGLAIAFVIGQAASKLVTAFVDDIITPFIGLFLPAGDLKAMSFTIGKSKFMWGDLISNVIDFLIIAFIVFLAYKQLSKFKLVEDKSKPEAKK
jgi:large conductance mechanosensitive channel